MSIIHEHLCALYGEALGAATFERLTSLPGPLSRNQTAISGEGERTLSSLAKRGRVGVGVQSILITYGDQLQTGDQPP